MFKIPVRRRRAGLLGALLIAGACAGVDKLVSPLQVPVVPQLTLSSAASPGVVMSQVYGGGGNGGSVLKNDYIELYNASGADVSLSGWSVQYASATGTTSWFVTPLSGTLPSGHYYLVQEAVGAGGTTSLPTPDATGTIAMSATAGKVAIVSSTTALSGSGCPPAATVVDFVGYGSTANCFQDGGPAPAPSNTTAAIRGDGGRKNTNSNAGDFTSGTPAPRNSASPALPPLNALTVSIAPTSPSVQPGTTVNFIVTATKSGQTIAITSAAWTTSNAAVATIDAATGVASALTTGSTTIGITVTTASDGSAATSTVLSVANAPATVTVTPATWSLKVNATKTFTASALDAAGQPITATYTWSVADPAIATINASTGLLTGKVVGSTTITATSANGKQGSATVTVTPATGFISVQARTSPLPVGFQTQLFLSSTGTDAAGNPVTNADVTWSSADATIASVTATTAIVTANAPGSVVITATAKSDGVTTGSTTVTTNVAAVSPAARTGHNTELGTPVDATPNDDILVARRQYTLSYNASRGGPNWVSWNLDATHKGSASRCNCFTADTALTRLGVHPYDTNDWVNGGIWSRGHMSPSADWADADGDNAPTFFLSNMIPQNQTANSGAWGDLENYLRTLATGTTEIYIVAGPIFTKDRTGPGVDGLGFMNSIGRIAVPDSMWKVAMVVPDARSASEITSPSDVTVIAVNMANAASSTGSWSGYTTTIDKIQKSTGYDLLSGLPERIQCRLEARNCPPSSHITGAGTAGGSEGQTLAFSAATSTDPDAGAVLSYEWTIAGQVLATTAELTRTFADDGAYSLRLIVADQQGAADTTTTVVTVGNVAPVIASVTNTSEGDVSSVSAAFSDVGVNDAPWRYSIDWNDGATSTGSVASQGATIAAAHPYARPGTYDVSVVVTDKDGAASAPVRTSLTVRDRTPPVIAYTVTGTAGLNGWYTGGVTVKWTATDAESAITSSACADNVLTTNTAGTVFTCAATSEGGTATSSETIKRDASTPVVTGAVSGTKGVDGWYTGDVTVTWSARSDVSPVSATPCAAVSLTTNTDGVTYTCTATNEAGGSATGTVTVKRDATKPVVTPTAAGTPGTNGWFVSNVALSWGITGAGPSSVTSTPSCTALTLSTDTQGTTYTCTATTGAGIATTESITLTRDITPPVVTPTVSGPLGSNGWYTGDATVSWSATDNVSSVAAVPCVANTLSVDNSGTTYTCSTVNDAGLTGSLQQTVKRDATRPVIGYTGNAGSYTVDVAVSITCAASDATSGLAANTCANITGPAYTFALGTTSFSATATDRAGNVSSANGSFTMGVTAPTLCTLVRRWSSSEGVANSLCVKLSHGDYAPFRLEVQAQSGKKIDTDKATILLRLVDAL
ncbi:hypothetical protein BH11GEM1_BH11GEM1_08670 [soil metagenome]